MVVQHTTIVNQDAKLSTFRFELLTPLGKSQDAALLMVSNENLIDLEMRDGVVNILGNSLAPLGVIFNISTRPY
jgi:hypothetical protein